MNRKLRGIWAIVRGKPVAYRLRMARFNNERQAVLIETDLYPWVCYHYPERKPEVPARQKVF